MNKVTLDSLRAMADDARAETHSPRALPNVPGRGTLLQEMDDRPANDVELFEGLFEMSPPVLEWIELVERRSGQGDLARLLLSMEAFIEKVSPEVLVT